MKSEWLAGAAVAAVMALSVSACDAGPSAVAARDQTTIPASFTAPATPAGAAERVAMIDGRPMWAANRDNTGEENARRQFERNGADFGARSAEAYVRAAHDFVHGPQGGLERIERPNGDLLIYDPKANVFAVVARDGAPRTLFKPRDGAAYWAEQKASGAERAEAGTAAGQG